MRPRGPAEPCDRREPSRLIEMRATRGGLEARRRHLNEPARPADVLLEKRDRERGIAWRVEGRYEGTADKRASGRQQQMGEKAGARPAPLPRLCWAHWQSAVSRRRPRPWL